jgi:hypothetical protein
MRDNIAAGGITNTSACDNLRSQRCAPLEESELGPPHSQSLFNLVQGTEGMAAGVRSPEHSYYAKCAGDFTDTPRLEIVMWRSHYHGSHLWVATHPAPERVERRA